jgi:hypothetical protein
MVTKRLQDLTGSEIQGKAESNIYLHIPLDRCIVDALHGVSLARTAWRIRNPDAAGKALGPVVEAEQ